MKINTIVILTLSILLSSFSIAQKIPQLELTTNGVEPIVVKVDDMNASKIYKKAKNWVKETYKNPDKVLKADITNKKIIISGYASNAWSYKTFISRNTFDMEYRIEISFKDGRYRFEFIPGQFYTGNGQKVLYDYESFFKRNGKVKKTYSEAPPTMEETMNDLSQSFFDYVSGKVLEDDW